MSCLDSDKCKEYKQNRGNPYPWQSPCNFCDKNMSDYDLGYKQGRADAIDERAKLLAYICKKYDIPLLDMNCTVEEWEQLKEESDEL